MRIGKSHILSLTIGLIPFVGAMYFLNRTPIGPEVENKQTYLGCYGFSAQPVLKVDADAVNGFGASQSTKLKRILSIKNDDAINTERELFFNPSNQSLEVGDRDTGFFYVFRRGAQEKTLILYDRQGRSYQLPKRPC